LETERKKLTEELKGMNSTINLLIEYVKDEKLKLKFSDDTVDKKDIDKRVEVRRCQLESICGQLET